MANPAENLQALGAMIQSSLSLGSLIYSVFEALHLSSNAGSEMDTRKKKLKKLVEELIHKIYVIYWSPNKQFEEWLKMVVETCNSAQNVISSTRISHPLVMTSEIQNICAKFDKCEQEGKSLVGDLKNRAIKRVVEFRNLTDITNVKTLKKKLNKILEELEGERSVLINHYGEFGTGKSVILEHLNNDKIVRKEFAIVIWASASYNENPENNSNIVAGIQRIIAERLGIDIQGNNDVKTLAEKIDAELKGAKFLLLLDNVMDIFDVNAIGLPRDDNGSKIVITTIIPYKLKSVFEGEKSHIHVNSERLDEADSWQMFENLLENDNLRKHHDFASIARRVAKWCDGHFLLIKIAAESFKSKDRAESWEYCFKMIKRTPKKEDGYMIAMEQILKLCYETLTEKQKLCYLFCALYSKENGRFGSKIPIHCLIDCWAALEFLDYDHKVEVPSPSGYHILESFIKKSLLNKDPQDEQYVMMSKLLRGLALHYLEQRGGYVAVERLEEERLHGCTWLSLANCNIKLLPHIQESGKVTTLFLQKNSELEEIPMEFIDHMKELQVLDLHKTGIKSIQCVSILCCLKVLYVNSCNLSESFSVGIEGLHELEVLDIRGIAITQIPDDIKKLKKLRRLMISISGGCDLDHLYISGILQLKELIVDVKSGTQLMELIVDGKSNDASKEKDYYHSKEVTRIIRSIHNLDELWTLQFHFHDVVVPVIEVLGTISKISVPNLESLVHLLGGKAFLEHEDLKVHIGLKPNVDIFTHIHVDNSLIRPSDKNGKKYEPGTIYSNEQTHILIKNDEICNVSTSTGNMNDIHSCLVYECNKVETFMKTAGFSSLKILILSKCSALKVLFSNNTLLEMGIEHLEIRDCPVIEDIDNFGDGGGEVVLPSLMTLVLYNLPELKLEKSLMRWPLLKTLRMHRCGNMTKLPFNVDGPNKLCTIEVEKTWWDEKLRLSGDSIETRFSCLKFSDI